MLSPFLSSIGTSLLLEGRLENTKEFHPTLPKAASPSALTHNTQTAPPSPDLSAALQQAHFHPRVCKRKLKPISKGRPSQITCT